MGRSRAGSRVLYRITGPSLVKLCRIVCGGLSRRLAKGLDALDRPGF